MKKFTKSLLMVAFIAIAGFLPSTSHGFAPLVIKVGSKYAFWHATQWWGPSPTAVTFNATDFPGILNWPSTAYQTSDMIQDKDPVSGYWGYSSRNNATIDRKLKSYQNSGASGFYLDDTNAGDTYVTNQGGNLTINSDPIYVRVNDRFVHGYSNQRIVPMLSAWTPESFVKGADGKSPYQRQIEYYQLKELAYPWLFVDRFNDGRAWLKTYHATLWVPIGHVNDQGKRDDFWYTADQQAKEISSVTKLPYNQTMCITHEFGHTDDIPSAHTVLTGIGPIINGGQWPTDASTDWFPRYSKVWGYWPTFASFLNGSKEATVSFASDSREHDKNGIPFGDCTQWICNGEVAPDVTLANGMATFMMYWNDLIVGKSIDVADLHQDGEYVEQGPFQDVDTDAEYKTSGGIDRFAGVTPVVKGWRTSHGMPFVPYSDVPVDPAVLPPAAEPSDYDRGWLDYVNLDGSYGGWSKDDEIRIYKGDPYSGGKYITTIATRYARPDIGPAGTARVFPGLYHGYSNDDQKIDVTGLKGPQDFRAYAVTAGGTQMYRLNDHGVVDFGGVTVITPPYISNIHAINLATNAGYCYVNVIGGNTVVINGWADNPLAHQSKPEVWVYEIVNGVPKFIGSTNTSTNWGGVLKCLGLSTDEHAPDTSAFSISTNGVTPGMHTYKVYVIDGGKTQMWPLIGSPLVVSIGGAPVPTLTPGSSATPPRPTPPPSSEDDDRECPTCQKL